MLFDLLSTDMYVSYNIRLAHILNLNSAVYISELINIYRKATLKGKLTNDFFAVDRNYIEKRTTLSEDVQREIDVDLSNLNIVQKGESKDLLKLNMDSITGLMLEKDKKLVAEVAKGAIKKRGTKAEAIKSALKAKVSTTNPELLSAYYEWIDAVYAKQGWMSSASVTNGQKVIDEYTQRDLDMALDILSIASINGWRDLNWAIEDFKKKGKNKNGSFYTFPNSTVRTPSVEMSDETF